jgi:hypothetical protein
MNIEIDIKNTARLFSIVKAVGDTAGTLKAVPVIARRYWGRPVLNHDHLIAVENMLDLLVELEIIEMKCCSITEKSQICVYGFTKIGWKLYDGIQS